LTSVDDILSELSYLDGLRPSAIPDKPGAPVRPAGRLTEDESAVYACFGGGAVLNSDALAAQSGLPVDRLSATLMLLELKRLIAKRADGAFEARS
jgi:DNA processing protein